MDQKNIERVYDSKTYFFQLFKTKSLDLQCTLLNIGLLFRFEVASDPNIQTKYSLHARFVPKQTHS